MTFANKIMCSDLVLTFAWSIYWSFLWFSIDFALIFHFSACSSLFKNKLVNIPANAFNNLASLKRLRLDGNPIACDCGVYSLWQHYHRQPQRNQIVITLICESPAALRRYGFANWQARSFHCSKSDFWLLLYCKRQLNFANFMAYALHMLLSLKNLKKINWQQ